MPAKRVDDVSVAFSVAVIIPRLLLFCYSYYEYP